MILRRPNNNDEDAIRKYLSEFEFSAEGGGHLNLLNNEDFKTILKMVKNEEKGIVNKDRCPATQFLYFENDNLIGLIQLRHELNDFLFNYGGHIGYSIASEFRKRGYATNMLKACLQEARKIGLKKVLITCKDWNIASSRVIEKNGGQYEDTRELDGISFKRFWIKL